MPNLLKLAIWTFFLKKVCISETVTDTGQNLGLQGLYYVGAPYFENFIIFKIFAKIGNLDIFWNKGILETVTARAKRTKIWDHKYSNMFEYHTVNFLKFVSTLLKLAILKKKS